MADPGPERSSPRRARRKKPGKDAPLEMADSGDSELVSPRNVVRSPRRGQRSPPMFPSPSPRTHRKSEEVENRPRTDSEAGLDLDDDVLLVDAVESDSPLLQLPQEVLIRILEMMEPTTLGLTSGVCQYLRSVSQLAWMQLTKVKYSKVRCIRDFLIAIGAESGANRATGSIGIRRQPRQTRTSEMRTIAASFGASPCAFPVFRSAWSQSPSVATTSNSTFPDTLLDRTLTLTPFLSPLLQYTTRDWRLLLRRFSHSRKLLQTALLRTPLQNREARPPSQPWQFLYFHCSTIRFRNWLAPRGTYSSAFAMNIIFPKKRSSSEWHQHPPVAHHPHVPRTHNNLTHLLLCTF